jgi:predicted ATPase/DNA-binding XRE family transcriptional regulator
MRGDPASFGTVLRQLRTAAALSQEELAERAGVSVRGISDLERGVHRTPHLVTVRLLADALTLDPADRAALLTAARQENPADPQLESLARYGLLPVPLTSLIGRERELAEVTSLLGRAEGRLTTLTGPGGVGKTRLALKAAADLLETFPDGVWFVDLSALTDAALVLPTTGAVLGMRAGEVTTQRLAASLASKRVLLVLDNFERVVEAAPVVAEVLGQAPGVKMLVTSRTPLHAYGEREYPLSPLPLPDPVHIPPLDRLNQYEVVRLFIERAQAIKPDFTVTSANASAVAEICIRLDGLPLAIELAAAHIKVLPPQALLRRMEKRLPLLTGGARTVPARQQTMHQTIAWSHDLLDQDEQAPFRRLAVFADGCTLQAAEAVVSPEGTGEVLRSIAALVDTSLLWQEEGVDGEPRFRMLETVREFGLERLQASGEESAIRDHHAGYFLALLERRDPVDSDPAWLDDIDREHDNLRAALAWSRDSGDYDRLLRLAGALAFFWYYRGHINEGRHWLDQALQVPVDAGSARPRAWALTAGGMLASVAGETDRAVALLTESFAWWAQTGDDYGQAMASSFLGGVYVSQGQYDEAAPLFAANEPVFRDAGQQDWLWHASLHLGVIAWAQGDEAPARSRLQDAMGIADRNGVPADAIDPLRYLGLMACAAGDLGEATMWFRDEVIRLRQLGSRAALAVGLADVATLAAAREAWQPAVRLFAKAETLLQNEAAAFTLPAREHYERAQARGRQALGEVASQATADAGRALTLEQALDVAEEVLSLDDIGPRLTTASDTR